MHVCVVYAHPSKDSFTADVLAAFLEGLKAGGHTADVRDLYEMDFKTDMDVAQYRRETGDDPFAPVPADVAREQQALNRARGLAIIYPVWWSDCPAKLKGWFDRVFTYGYAYFHGGPIPDPGVVQPLEIERAVVLCPAGQTMAQLEETGVARGMKYIMLNDRLGNSGIREASMEILAGTTGDDGTVKSGHLKRVYEIGKHFADGGHLTEQRTEAVRGCCSG